MRAISIVDNVSLSEKLEVEEGFSVMVETKAGKILVDCGATGSVLLGNAEKLNVDLGSIDILIISHHHFDHTGGLWDFLRINDKAKVYCIEPDFNRPKYVLLCNLVPVRIGLSSESKKMMKKYADRFSFVERGEVFSIRDNHEIVLISQFGHTHKLPTCNDLVFKYDTEKGAYEKDKFDHELAVVIRPNNTESMMLISPCSHNGILNIVDQCVETISKDYNDRRNMIVVGGFHLSMNLKLYEYKEYGYEVKKIAEKLMENRSVGKVYTGHCTGIASFNIMKEVDGGINYLFCGEEIVVKDL